MLIVDKWKLFLNDAEDAIKSSELLFNHEFYGKSAFHAQQCVELSIKTYLLKFQPIEKDFNNHLPLKLILRNLRRNTELLKKLKSKAVNPRIESLLDKTDTALQDIIKKMDKSDKKEEHKKELWKCSMGISELNQEDFKILKEFQDIKNNQFENEVVGLIVGMVKNLLSKIKRSMKKELKKCLLSETIKNGIIDDGIKNGIIEIMFSDNSEESIWNEICVISDKIKNSGRNMLDLLFEPNGLLVNIIKNRNTGKVEMLNPVELQTIFHMVYIIQHTEISLFTLPHETLGRYSVAVDDRTTKDLYRENKDSLQKLIEKSRRVFEQTDSIIKQYEELDDMIVPNR